MMCMPTPDLIRRHLERRGWSISELARRAGLPRNTISRIISERRSTRMATLEKIAAALGVSVKQLVE
jgi:gp16 family phage-associated protein